MVQESQDLNDRYEPKRDAGSVREARVQFILAIYAEAPEVIESLGDRPFALYEPHWLRHEERRHIESARLVSNGFWDERLALTKWPRLKRRANIVRSLQPLRDSLLEWTRRRHLEEDWILSCAVEILNFWAANQDAKERLDWGEKVSG